MWVRICFESKEVIWTGEGDKGHGSCRGVGRSLDPQWNSVGRGNEGWELGGWGRTGKWTEVYVVGELREDLRASGED